MTSVWVGAVSRSLEEALDRLGAAVRDCTDESWDSSMWQVEPLGPDHQFLDERWAPVTDPTRRQTLERRWVERRSTPWSVAWHALEGLDYDLSGEFEPWAPPSPFAGHPHWRDLSSLPGSWSQAEMLGYIEYCRQRVRDTLGGMTDEQAARPLPEAHRYRGQPHARIITSAISHTTEHAAQIRQFITDAENGP